MDKNTGTRRVSGRGLEESNEAQKDAIQVLEDVLKALALTPLAELSQEAITDLLLTVASAIGTCIFLYPQKTASSI